MNDRSRRDICCRECGIEFADQRLFSAHTLNAHSGQVECVRWLDSSVVDANLNECLFTISYVFFMIDFADCVHLQRIRLRVARDSESRASTRHSAAHARPFAHEATIPFAYVLLCHVAECR
jgi:hypothetical protein